MEIESFLQKAKALGIPLENLGDGEFVIHNYFFGNSDPSVKLYFDADGFNIRSIQGFWTEIKDPAEIISLNYYEHYLPRQKDLEIPKEWQELYNNCGIHDNSKDHQSARRRSLLQKVEIHFTLENGLKDLDFWQEVAKEFPECVYTGPAYRAVLTAQEDFDKSKLANAGYSWALSLDGIKEFIFNGDTYLEEDPGFMLAKGTIQGISLIHISKIFQEDFHGTVNEGSIFHEEEVILFELLSLDKVELVKAKDLGSDFKF